ncbi:MAG: SDR family oxidoreductase [Cyanobacteria bacterium P01_A01_bin.84]
MMSNSIFLAGASKGVGREIAKYLVADKAQVIALLRTEDARTELEAMGIKVILGDALNIMQVEQAVLGENNLDTVITTIGGLPQIDPKPDYLANKNLIDAALKAKVRKFILITSIGCGESVVALNPQALETLGSVLVEKEKAEQYLINSGLTYTIIRPGGLKSEQATGNAILTSNYQAVGSIHRADVAQFACRCLASEKTNNQILSAVDKNMLFTQQEFEEFSLM